MNYRLPTFRASYGFAAIILTMPGLCQGQDPVLQIGAFSSADIDQPLPSEWVPLTFPQVSRHTKYELVKDGDTTVVRATSHNAASGLARSVSIDLKQYPIVQWRWKINNVLVTSDATTKQGDDYPARLYITFDYDVKKLSWIERLKQRTYRALYGEAPPLAVLNYLWESHLPIDTLLANAYTERVQMIVVRSGANQVGEWVEEERNIYQDYLRAFAETPPTVSSVAIMTDTDNTGESAITFYGDIRFLPARPYNR